MIKYFKSITNNLSKSDSFVKQEKKHLSESQINDHRMKDEKEEKIGNSLQKRISFLSSNGIHNLL